MIFAPFRKKTPCWLLGVFPPFPITEILPVPLTSNVLKSNFTPSKFPAVGVVCWLASITISPFSISMLLPPCKSAFRLTLIVTEPVPERARLAKLFNVTRSAPGVASSFCKSIFKLALGAKVRSPENFTSSLPVSPLRVRLGSAALTAKISMRSLPVPALTVMDVTSANKTVAGKLAAAVPLRE